MAKAVRRLYPSFHPSIYSLDLNLDPRKLSFSGSVMIDGLKAGRPSKRLTLHQKNLKILSAKVKYFNKEGSHVIKVNRINYQKSFDEVRLHFKDNLKNGRYVIEIKYTGLVNTQLHGIYLSKAKTNGKTSKILCTQFESHSAREAFPCIDEPEAKSIFNLAITLPKSVPVVLSNTEVLTSNTKSDLKTVKFNQTPRMSSYLLAFVVGDFKYLEAKTKNNVTVRTYATINNVKNTKFALDCAVKTLEFYDEYFNIPYPLSKCDLVALPDFASLAMENWGLITFREQGLVVDEHTSLDFKVLVSSVVAHELTHQWFGNLVTMKWWNDLWLNESFASWMSYLAVDHLFPEWKVWARFIVEDQALGLNQDSLENTHPIEVKIGSPDEIRTVFDAISYDKGASVITMLHDYLGPDVFRDGIRLYLSKNTYSNTDTSDLWSALEEVSSKPVSQFMNKWTTTPGYPLIRFRVGESSARIEQNRFFLNPKANINNSTWPIPLFSDIQFGKNDPLKHRSLNLLLRSQPTSLLINKGRRGFYRVIYDDQTMADILGEEFLSSVDEIDRYALISDAFEASKAGYMSASSALYMLESFFNETNVIVWEAIAASLGAIRLVMNDDDVREKAKPFIRALVDSQLKRLGMQAKSSDNHFDKLLRPIILGMAASADEPSVIKHIDRLFNGPKRSSIDPDLRGVVYTSIARHGDEKEFKELVRMHNSTDSSEEKMKLIAAITNFKQSELIDKALKLIKTDDVRSQDVGYWIAYSFLNHYGRDQAWKWFKDNWDFITKALGEDLSFYRMPMYVARSYSSIEFLKEFNDFFNDKMDPAFDRPIKQAIETITWQSEWKKRDLDKIKNFFIDWSKANSM